MTLYNWIAKGAPDKNGNVPFASDPDTRQKIYLTEQGCDLVSVIDAKSMLIMRYIPVGVDPQITEAPHSIVLSEDGMNAYVCFYASGYVQKIDTRIDTVVASVNVGAFVPGGGSWGIIESSPGADSEVVVTDYEATGSVATVNTKTMKLEGKYRNGLDLVYPHGVASNPTWDTFFISAEYGNTIYKFFPAALQIGDPAIKKISIDGNPPVETDSNSSRPDPHEVEMAPDHSKYFITCQGTNEIRVMDAHADTLIKAIPVGAFPQEVALSGKPETPYLFVACMRDKNNPGYANGIEGSVYVIDYNTYNVIKIIYGDFAQPHDVAVDDINGLLFVPSTNGDPNGPPPHHVTVCGGKAGWYTVYKIGPNSFVPVNKRFQTTVFPYSIGTRFSE
jgi:DNA-binding beta-propeller fold protein YncE